MRIAWRRMNLKFIAWTHCQTKIKLNECLENAANDIMTYTNFYQMVAVLPLLQCES
jgi:hypothetical protein